MTVTDDIDVRLLEAIGDAMPMHRKEIRIHPEMRLHADLGLDSLGLLALLFRLQEVFALKFDDDPDIDVGAMRTVDDLLRVARELLAPEPRRDPRLNGGV
jgi:acyl carrier protein